MARSKVRNSSWYRNSFADRKNYSAAFLLFSVLLIRFLVQLSDNHASPTVKGHEFMDILIVAVTVIVVAIPGELSFYACIHTRIYL